uniref:Uncharacterized protein n=1 Tax=Anguilla anguilla TaxID=7936 RepID=A0A0E9Q6V0_ANGAN
MALTFVQEHKVAMMQWILCQVLNFPFPGVIHPLSYWHQFLSFK